MSLSKFDTNKIQKPVQCLVEVQVYVEVTKEAPPEDKVIWEEVDGFQTQLVPCLGGHWLGVAPVGQLVIRLCVLVLSGEICLIVAHQGPTSVLWSLALCHQDR